LANLASTAGAEVVGAEWQNRRHVDPNWYVGKGKAEELARARSETGFSLLIADDELSPSQQKALESLLNVKVIQRSRFQPADPRRRAVAKPAEGAREPAERQGHRPEPADPRHLRPPRSDPRGPPPGRARPARIPAAAADAPLAAPVADRRRDRDAGTRREPARDRSAD